MRCSIPCATATSGTEAALVFPGWPGLHDLVNEAELLCLVRRQKPVALDRVDDRLERLAGVFDVDFVESRAQPQDLTRLDLDVGGLTLGPARGLVDHDVRIRQREALALGACGEEQRAHG